MLNYLNSSKLCANPFGELFKLFPLLFLKSCETRARRFSFALVNICDGVWSERKRAEIKSLRLLSVSKVKSEQPKEWHRGNPLFPSSIDDMRRAFGERLFTKRAKICSAPDNSPRTMTSSLFPSDFHIFHVFQKLNNSLERKCLHHQEPRVIIYNI